MAVRDDRSDVKQTTTGFRGPLMVQSLTSAKSKFLSLKCVLLQLRLVFAVSLSDKNFITILSGNFLSTFSSLPIPANWHKIA